MNYLKETKDYVKGLFKFVPYKEMGKFVKIGGKK